MARTGGGGHGLRRRSRQNGAPRGQKRRFIEYNLILNCGSHYPFLRRIYTRCERPPPTSLAPSTAPRHGGIVEGRRRRGRRWGGAGQGCCPPAQLPNNGGERGGQGSEARWPRCWASRPRRRLANRPLPPARSSPRPQQSPPLCPPPHSQQSDPAALESLCNVDSVKNTYPIQMAERGSPTGLAPIHAPLWDSSFYRTEHVSGRVHSTWHSTNLYDLCICTF